MKSGKKPKYLRKIRIVKNVKDGKVLTWTPLLSKHEDYFSGWRFIYDDDSMIDEMDKTQPMLVDKTTASAREQKLIEENSKLMEQLAQYEKPKGSNHVDSPDTVPIPTLEEHGIQNDLSMAALPEAEEEAISFQPEAPSYSKTKLNKMKREDLIIHAHDLDRDINLPDNAIREDLINICIDLQKQRDLAKED